MGSFDSEVIIRINLFLSVSSSNETSESDLFICSTGSPLSKDGFEFVYRNIKKNMTKDKNFNEILDGLKVESVKFMKKNET